jgi:hypothetical protein
LQKSKEAEERASSLPAYHSAPGIPAKPDEKIKPAESESRKMRKMRHAASKSKKRRNQLDQSEAQNHNRRSQGQNTPNVDYRVREKSGIRKLDGEDRAGRAQEEHAERAGKEIHPKGKKTGQDAREHIIQQKFGTADMPFNLSSEDKQGQHIKEKMLETSMGEHIGPKLPNSSIKDIYRVKGDIISYPRQDLLEDKHQNINPNNNQRDVIVTVSKGFTKRIHSLKIFVFAL